MTILKGGFNYYGIPVGVICLESYFPKPVGHIKYPASFDFPVLYKTVKGATIDRLIGQRDPELLQPFIEAAQELEREGVKAITASCGFLALFQREIADAVNIPVFISSLIQVPLIYQSLGRHRKVGVVVANSDALSVDHLIAVGADKIPIALAGMQHQPQFTEVILNAKNNDFDLEVFRDELFSVIAQMLVKDPNIGSIVLECTDLSHFAPQVQQRFNLPVYDLTSLTRMVAATVERHIA
ncbi:aspartate/glutamate racemase family protein [Gammaproteobacteria bacterium AS21]